LVVDVVRVILLRTAQHWEHQGSVVVVRVIPVRCVVEWE